MSTTQEQVIENQDGNSTPPPPPSSTPQVFLTEQDIHALIANYRQGIMQLKARRDFLMADLQEVEQNIAHTEGAILGFSGLVKPNAPNG